MKKSVVIINGNPEYKNMFLKMGWDVLSDFERRPDLVQFTGGADISPQLYNAKMHNTMSINPRRDDEEVGIFDMCQIEGIPMAGICRGSQFLHAMSGNKLWQDVDNHAVAGGHIAHVIGGLGDVHVSSTHHQMMAEPTTEGSIVLVEANLSTYKHRVEMDEYVKDTGSRDIESCYHENINALCFQPHPEFGGFDKCRDLYFFLLNNYLFGGEND